MNNNKKIFIYCLVFVFFILYNILLCDKITNNVLNKLRKEYTPGPYEPGFNKIEEKKTLSQWNEYWKNI